MPQGKADTDDSRTPILNLRLEDDCHKRGVVVEVALAESGDFFKNFDANRVHTFW
jgi:hypothetical protein